MERRTPEEELEYRRYLRKRIRMRKRRRQVMIARTIVGVVGLVMVFLIFYGIGKITGPVGGEDKKRAEATAKPTATPFVVDAPEGYEEVCSKLYDMREDHPEVDDILINVGKYPLDLLELLTKNTETLSFVCDYLMHVDDEEATSGIVEDDLVNMIPLLQQWDKRWGYTKYGDNMLAINGCGPTCMSMVYTGLTGNVDKNPAVLADFCIDNSYYTDDSGTSWALMTSGAEALGLNAEKLSLTQDEIKERIEMGQPVICSMMPGDFTETGHFIVLWDITEEGKLLVNDPNSILRSQTEWDFEVVFGQIKAAWAYSYTAE